MEPKTTSQTPAPEYSMGAMSPQPVVDHQQPLASPGQQPQPQQQQGHFEHQQYPPSYPQQAKMDPTAPVQPQMSHPVMGYGVPLVSLGSQPSPITCPHCGHRGMTAISHESGGFTHLVALVVCWITCLGCIPYLVSGLKDVHHMCPSCNIPLATYHRSGRTEVHYQPGP